ncbi:MAG: type II toxin-antitoxin system HipA family toxin [Planctomycetes bacterium]|nr:type II toxin-antitoxin system HipA family toxin [Planctomycetota bacterium]
MGRVLRTRQGKLSFVYDEAWRATRGAFPLSLALPLAAAEHPSAPIEAYLWGLLPDNEAVLERWARRFQVSARNVFGLLAEVGEECAGAVQFVREERWEMLREESAPRIDWLEEKDLEQRLRALREDHAASRRLGDAGQFSLAGAQPKTALFHDGARWGIPAGRTPTTHILKPPTGEFDGHAENEHFCLALARSLGLPAAHSRVVRFGGEVAIAVERYDRARLPDGRVVRLHQEDLCQALGVPPLRKYESEGGPGIRAIHALLRESSSKPEEDARTFVDALIFQWLIAGTDAHAKNYALLHAPGPRVRLAPLYDLASALPYPQQIDAYRASLAMKVGGKAALREIGPKQWASCATELGLAPRELLARGAEQAERLVARAFESRDALAREGLDHPLVPRLAEALAARGKERGAVLRAALQSAE